jgi:hypothetical protein
MTHDQSKLEQFLNNLEGEVVAIVPNVTQLPSNYVDFLLIVERIGPAAEASQGFKEKTAV